MINPVSWVLLDVQGIPRETVWALKLRALSSQNFSFGGGVMSGSAPASTHPLSLLSGSSQKT